MPLPPLDLDTRTYDDLVDEARALIPRYASQWTDYNATDPGITLLELFAWLVEQDIYRVNRVPARHRAAFVALTGTTVAPPEPASAIVQFSPQAGGDGLVIDAGQTLTAAGTPGTPGIPYTTTAPLTLTATSLGAIQVFDGTAFTDVTAAWNAGQPFAALSSDPRPGCALYLGFDAALPAGREVTLALAFGDGRRDAGERDRIATERAPRGPLMSVQWELWDGGDWRVLRPDQHEVDDATFGLTLDGSVRVTAPAPSVASIVGAVEGSLHWLRCELAGGAPDAAPAVRDVAVNAVAAAQQVPVRSRFAIAPGTPPPPTAPTVGTVEALAMTLDATGAITALDVGGPDDPRALVLAYTPATATVPGELVVALLLAGRGTGGPRQRLLLEDVTVAGGALAAWTLEPAGPRSWAIVSTLGAAGPHDAAFTLDPQTGLIEFGDGRRGRVLPEAAPLVVAYDVTLAGSGNVAPGTRFTLDGVAAAQVAEIRARVGGAPGADAETLDHAAGRAAAALWSHERLLELAEAAGADTLDQLDRASVLALPAPARAATALDFERLAIDVPGVRAARVRAFGGLDARYPELSAPGTVSVIVVAGVPVAQPAPSGELLDTVMAYLARRKTLGTRLVVVAPSYVEVTVTATVSAVRGADPSAVSAAAVGALRTFIDPVAGGPAMRGWPFGRDVHRTEILAHLDAVSGVEAVTALTLTGPDGATCNLVCVGATGLACSGSHTVQVTT